MRNPGSNSRRRSHEESPISYVSKIEIRFRDIAVIIYRKARKFLQSRNSQGCREALTYYSGLDILATVGPRHAVFNPPLFCSS